MLRGTPAPPLWAGSQRVRSEGQAPPVHRLPVTSQEEPGTLGSLTPQTCVWADQKSSVSLKLQPPCIRLGTGSQGMCPNQASRGQQGEKKCVLGTGAAAQWAEHPPGMQKTQGSIPSLQKPGMGTLGRQGDQGYPQLHNGFKASLGSMRQCLKPRELGALFHSPRHAAPSGEVAPAVVASCICSQLFLPPLWEQTSSQHPCPHHGCPLPK